MRFQLIFYKCAGELLSAYLRKRLSVSYMGAIERGEKIPKLKIIINTANALKISSDTLLPGVPDVGNQVVASELSKELSGIPKSDQIRILNVIRAVTDNMI